MTGTMSLPNDESLGLSFGAYISMLRNAGSYHWYSREGSVEQLRDYVWDLMNLRPTNLEHGMSSKNETLEFMGVQSSVGAVLTCFWKNESGSETIVRAVNREWEGIAAKLETGTYIGLPWNVRNTLMMFGDIDSHSGLTELYEFLQDGQIVSLAVRE